MDLSNITINTHSSICIKVPQVLYFDPFQIKEAKQDADIIFVSHEHYDHFEPESIGKIKKESTVLVAPASMQKQVLKESGIAEANCVFCEPGMQYEIAGLQVTAVPAYTQPLKPFHPKAKKWLGYIVEADGIRYYVAGDTDVNEDIKKVQCDVALIPIGGHYTMNKEQAAEYILGLQPGAVIPTHYGSVVGKPSDGADFKQLVEAGNAGIQVELKL